MMSKSCQRSPSYIIRPPRCGKTSSETIAVTVQSFGAMLHPARDLRDVRFTQADGSRFAWRHEDHTWRVLVAPPADCGASCEELADKLRRIWVGLGNHAASVQVMWVGAAPRTGFRSLLQLSADPSLAARLPDTARADAIPVYVVDPSGYLILRYAPGFNPRDLRRDLTQLVSGGVSE